MTKRTQMKLILTCLFLLLTFVCFATTAKVVRIIDGDTFETDSGDKVRLIGINAPEISDIFGPEAKQYLTDLIFNKVVDLQPDDMNKDRDRYHRLLRYVILDGVDINEKLVSEGFAFAYLKYGFSKSLEYERAQREARESNKGIWGDSSMEANTNEQAKNELSNLIGVSPRVYVVGSLLVFLLGLGFYAYFKK